MNPPTPTERRPRARRPPDPACRAKSAFRGAVSNVAGGGKQEEDTKWREGEKMQLTDRQTQMCPSVRRPTVSHMDLSLSQTSYMRAQRRVDRMMLISEPTMTQWFTRGMGSNSSSSAKVLNLA